MQNQKIINKNGEEVEDNLTYENVALLISDMMKRNNYSRNGARTALKKELERMGYSDETILKLMGKSINEKN